MEKRTAVGVSPAQAQWIVERLIADRRITAAEVRSILAGLAEEIRELEGRLAGLRDEAGATAVATPAQQRQAPDPKGRKRTGIRKKGHPRGIAGTLAVLLRSIPAAEHAAIGAIRADKGIKAAIKAAQGAAKVP